MCNFYLCNSLHKNICLHFFIFILLSVLIFYVSVSLSSVSPSSRCETLILGVHISNNQQVVPAVVVTTRPDKRGEQVDTLHSGSSKVSKKPVLQKTRCNSGQFDAVLSEDFCAHKILSLTFMQILADDRPTFA